MQITSNTTRMLAELSVAADKEGRDYCAVVVKGTFAVDTQGEPALAEEQKPLVYADVHYGDPGTTSIRCECDFALFKPRTDVIVNGHAYSPGGEKVDSVEVALELEGNGTSLRKSIRVIGDRQWQGGILGLSPSRPVPFDRMPLVYERAFGGSEHSRKDQKSHGSDLRNPVGVGYWTSSELNVIKGTPVPNLEHPEHPIRSWSDKPPPIGLGVIGRGWQPRVKYAGTYDEQWFNERRPFLPADFDERYFQSAPEDQQVSHLKGGESVVCRNMTARGDFAFRVPNINFPIKYRFRDRDLDVSPRLDTLIIEPDDRKFIVCYRAQVESGPKLHQLRSILVGV